MAIESTPPYPARRHPSELKTGELRIPCGKVWLYGDLSLPPNFTGLVIFAHGSGSGRHSARNRQVAQALQNAGLATLLFDLLTPQEEQEDSQTRQHRFNIALLTQRMQEVTLWLLQKDTFKDVPIGYFGASTGSAAALIAAARMGSRVGAVVSRGGRPDLAGPVVLDSLEAPTLLIVGGADQGVIELNEDAFAHLHCEKQLAIVPRATHLFEEPGALAQVSQLAAAWFIRHLQKSPAMGQAGSASKHQAARNAGRALP
jgi:putative phosphoribosyl transferase